MGLCEREDVSNVCSLILWCRLQCGASVGFLDAGILARSAWYCSKVLGQPAGTASWWLAWVGWVAHYSSEKKSPAPRIVFPKVFTKMICLCLSTTGQRRTNSTTMTMLGHSNKYVANEIGEHRTIWIQTNMWRCSFQLSVYWQQVKG